MLNSHFNQLSCSQLDYDQLVASESFFRLARRVLHYQRGLVGWACAELDETFLAANCSSVQDLTQSLTKDSTHKLHKIYPPEYSEEKLRTYPPNISRESQCEFSQDTSKKFPLKISHEDQNKFSNDESEKLLLKTLRDRKNKIGTSSSQETFELQVHGTALWDLTNDRRVAETIQVSTVAEITSLFLAQTLMVQRFLHANKVPNPETRKSVQNSLRCNEIVLGIAANLINAPIWQKWQETGSTVKNTDIIKSILYETTTHDILIQVYRLVEQVFVIEINNSSTKILINDPSLSQIIDHHLDCTAAPFLQERLLHCLELQYRVAPLQTLERRRQTLCNFLTQTLAMEHSHPTKNLPLDPKTSQAIACGLLCMEWLAYRLGDETVLSPDFVLLGALTALASIARCSFNDKLAALDLLEQLAELSECDLNYVLHNLIRQNWTKKMKKLAPAGLERYVLDNAILPEIALFSSHPFAQRINHLKSKMFISQNIKHR